MIKFTNPDRAYAELQEELHDAYNEICTVKHTEKGVRLDETFKFTDIFN